MWRVEADFQGSFSPLIDRLMSEMGETGEALGALATLLTLLSLHVGASCRERLHQGAPSPVTLETCKRGFDRL